MLSGFANDDPGRSRDRSVTHVARSAYAGRATDTEPDCLRTISIASSIDCS